MECLQLVLPVLFQASVIKRNLLAESHSKQKKIYLISTNQMRQLQKNLTITDEEIMSKMAQKES